MDSVCPQLGHVCPTHVFSDIRYFCTFLSDVTVPKYQEPGETDVEPTPKSTPRNSNTRPIDSTGIFVVKPTSTLQAETPGSYYRECQRLRRGDIDSPANASLPIAPIRQPNGS